MILVVKQILASCCVSTYWCYPMSEPIFMLASASFTSKTHFLHLDKNNRNWFQLCSRKLISMNADNCYPCDNYVTLSYLIVLTWSRLPVQRLQTFSARQLCSKGQLNFGLSLYSLGRRLLGILWILHCCFFSLLTVISLFDEFCFFHRKLFFHSVSFETDTKFSKWVCAEKYFLGWHLYPSELVS